ncbi:MAG TPA: bifunctional diaminohydroxyphosphoribosylaminopyrimidine deaminase/5-amino-6-(5-phosphoribosylamino)uracil reductase RibD [Gammaproteobacteria bacterium]|nr:bifunctional diaminohydroxyphosphoribosylaminopyrimidine deaminase/5-amino-6-(5-phosphoribosylamino)uracil reductase RibD [Gammaproteobacteria bacterium]
MLSQLADRQPGTSPGFSADDHRFMARALQLAERGLWTTRPNPRVGCVIVRDGAVVGEGAHLRAGEGHAEVLALAAAGAAAQGATAYVTLEPCSHHGRTPPCAEALVAAGVTRVVAAMQDPNPRVAGQGLARLQAAGIATATGLLAAEAEALNKGFVRRMRDGRPYVRCKLAASLDGRTALASGESKWITSAAARRDVHRLRAGSDAIITGSGTVRADDPALTVRDVALPELWPGQPLRVVLDSNLTTPPDAAIVRGEGKTLILHAAEAPARAAALLQAGARVERIPAAAAGLDLQAVLARLAALEINEVLVEAGPTLAGGFVQAGLVDELVVYLAPHLMGHEGSPLLQLAGIATMDARLPLRIMDVRMVGEDLRVCARPETTG